MLTSHTSPQKFNFLTLIFLIEQSGIYDIKFVSQCLYRLHCSHLSVVVTTNNETTPSQVPDSDLVSYGDLGSSGALASYGGIVGDKSSIMYVAAILNGDLGEKMLVLGNEGISRVGDKEYYNAPLDRQCTYYTFFRAYANNHNASVST